MPHKKNPILSENICGLSRILKSYIHVAYDNIALWHERDISHSSTERIILPDATSLIHFMLHRYSNTLENLVVFPENMVHNIELSKGFYATQQILNAMVDQGYDRLSIHDHLQGLSRIVEEKKIHLKDVVLEDEFILSALGKNVIYDLFDYKRSLIHVPSIFKNVFNS